MSSLQNEPYVLSHTCTYIYIYIQTYTPILCIPVWLRLWIIDVFIICPSCALQTSRSFCSPVPQSLSLILFHVSLPQDAAAASVKPWLDEERTIDYQYGPAPSWSFPPSLALRYAPLFFFFKCFAVFLVVVTENKGLFLFFIFLKVLHVMQLLNWNNVGLILYRDSFYWIAHVSPLTYVFRLALELWFLYQNYCLNNF